MESDRRDPMRTDRRALPVRREAGRRQTDAGDMIANDQEPTGVPMRNDVRSSEELLTVADAVRESGFSEPTIRRHIDKGALPVVRRGPFRRIRIKREDFTRYLAGELTY
jgi:excisionase family DNA binding protein